MLRIPNGRDPNISTWRNQDLINCIDSETSRIPGKWKTINICPKTKWKTETH